MTQLLAFVKKALVPLGIAAAAVAYDYPSSGPVNERAVILVGIKAFLAAFGISVGVTSDTLRTAAAAVAKKAG